MSSENKGKLNAASAVFEPSFKTKNINTKSEATKTKEAAIGERFAALSIAPSSREAAITESQPKSVDNRNKYPNEMVNFSAGMQVRRDVGQEKISKENSYIPRLETSDTKKLKTYERRIDDFFMNKGLRDRLKMESIGRNSFRDDTSPRTIHHYTSLTPIDPPGPNYGLQGHMLKATFYKAFSSVDGKTYCIHRVHDCRSITANSLSIIKTLVGIQHPSIVRIREAFTTYAFGDSSLCLVYDYYPCSTNLGYDLYVGGPFSMGEAQAWCLIIQILSGLKVIHQHGLSQSILDPYTVLLINTNRLKIGWLGLSQILFQHPPKTIKTLQRQDFASVGFTFLSILSRTMNPQSSLAECMASVQLSYSLELNQLISMLISNNSRVNVDMILATYSHRLLAEYDLSLNRLDEMEANLSLELENGRLFRIISKLNFIIGRPGLKSDNKWSETGERYIISLFFGHIFHQVEADLKPVVDIAHVVMNLNKLDAGSTEHILLTSGDEKTCLVVTYKYIKECVEAAFNELVNS